MTVKRACSTTRILTRTRALSTTYKRTSSNQGTDLQDLAKCLSVPRLWTKLTTPELDLLVYATTRTIKQPFSVSHEKVICFSLDNHSDVVPSCYLGEIEKYGKITFFLEARNIFQKLHTACFVQALRARTLIVTVCSARTALEW